MRAFRSLANITGHKNILRGHGYICVGAGVERPTRLDRASIQCAEAEFIKVGIRACGIDINSTTWIRGGLDARRQITTAYRANLHVVICADVRLSVEGIKVT